MPIDFDRSRQLLEEAYRRVEARFAAQDPPEVPPEFSRAVGTLFRSGTQAFREVLIGCILARLQDKRINIRQPYADQGPRAFSGRTLDERVVNPFFQEKRIPSSRGPYLSVFRRSVEYNVETRRGLRDKGDYDDLLRALSWLEREDRGENLLAALDHVLYRFVELREEANIPILAPQRMSLGQYDLVVRELLTIPSGGRFPVLLAAAGLAAVNEALNQGWDVRVQGINVADRAAGVTGDIVVNLRGRPIKAFEITERPVDSGRVVATFNAKIAPAGIPEYTFLLSDAAVDNDAVRQAERYFAQGHEITFFDLRAWLRNLLGAIGPEGRNQFGEIFREMLGRDDVPRALRVAWNEVVARIMGG